MFRFAFNVEVDNETPFGDKNKENDSHQASSEIEEKKKSQEWYTAQKVDVSSELLENLDVYQLNATTLNVGDMSIKHVVTGFLLEHITSNSENNKDITEAEQTHSDLIPGIYEGGAKIWECTEDLLKYLAKNIRPQSWRNKRVLDLGCGAGLLGIYTHRCGAIVHFQDYNKDVLAQITIPNLLLNEVDKKLAANSDSKDAVESKAQQINIDDIVKNAEFYSGDWSKYSELTSKCLESKSDKFDYILTSETIYNPQNQQKLLDTFYAKLKSDGVVLVAAKTYYFGVGGGLRQFEALIDNDKRFRSKVVWTSTDGVGREILELRLNGQ